MRTTPEQWDAWEVSGQDTEYEFSIDDVSLSDVVADLREQAALIKKQAARIAELEKQILDGQDVSRGVYWP